MKQHSISAIRLTIATFVLLAVVYPLIVWGIAQLTPSKGQGEVIHFRGKNLYANIGQTFTADSFFWSRPSAVGYNAAGSGGSNKGPSNEAYLADVQARIDTFLVHNPAVKKSEIPVDLVTASGSGLDPNISIQAAKIQVERIARARKVQVAELNKLIENNTEGPLWGLFGPEKINVLKLNIALEQLK
jgi:K+-transporting ATPase ATPase C chain